MTKDGLTKVVKVIDLELRLRFRVAHLQAGSLRGCFDTVDGGDTDV